MFEEKALAAQEGGALGLIVANSEDALFIMSGKKQEQQSAKDALAVLNAATATSSQTGKSPSGGSGGDVAPVGSTSLVVPASPLQTPPATAPMPSLNAAALLAAALSNAAAINGGKKEIKSEQEMAAILKAAINALRNSGANFSLPSRPISNLPRVCNFTS